MTEKEIQFRKKRELGDILTDSLSFIRQETKPIAKLITIYVLPFLILYAIVQVYLQRTVISKIDFSNTENLMSNLGPIYTNLLLFALFGIFVQALLMAAYFSYIELYLKHGKDNFTFADVTQLLFSNGLLAIGVSLAIFIIVMFGLVLCFVPGIFFANTLSLAVFALIFEKKGIAHALTRSAFLVNRQWWNTFLINIVGLIIIWSISFVFSLPTMLAGLSVSLFSQGTSPADYPTWYWILSGIASVFSSVFYIIPYTFMAFQYFNIDERTKDLLPKNTDAL